MFDGVSKIAVRISIMFDDLLIFFQCLCVCVFS